jgi:hypothetical protein
MRTYHQLDEANRAAVDRLTLLHLCFPADLREGELVRLRAQIRDKYLGDPGISHELAESAATEMTAIVAARVRLIEAWETGRPS